MKATHFISTDSLTRGQTSIRILNSELHDFTNNSGCENLIHVPNGNLVDSIAISDSRFENNRHNVIVYTTIASATKQAKIRIERNFMNNQGGALLDLKNIHSGRTIVEISDNRFDNCITPDSSAFICLENVSKSKVDLNSFFDCNENKQLIMYKDKVKGNHYLQHNLMSHSGTINH